MSSNNPTGILAKYFVLKDLRNIVDIPDTIDDVDLQILGNTVDGNITTKLYPFSAQMPLQGDYLTMAQNASLLGVAALWKAKKENKELAAFYQKNYENAMNDLITSLKANRNVRSKRVSVATPYRTHLTYAQLRKF